jgi:hypothetical protein
MGRAEGNLRFRKQVPRGVRTGRVTIGVTKRLHAVMDNVRTRTVNPTGSLIGVGRESTSTIGRVRNTRFEAAPLLLKNLRVYTRSVRSSLRHRAKKTTVVVVKDSCEVRRRGVRRRTRDGILVGREPQLNAVDTILIKDRRKRRKVRATHISESRNVEVGIDRRGSASQPRNDLKRLNTDKNPFLQRREAHPIGQVGQDVERNHLVLAVLAPGFRSGLALSLVLRRHSNECAVHPNKTKY